jgi:integrase
MTDEVYNLIRICVAGKKPVDPVFTWEEGTPVQDFRKTSRNLTKAAGVPKLPVHDFRRSSVRNMVRNGVPEPVAMAISGHRTRRVFNSYNIVPESDLIDAAAKRNKSREIGRRMDTEQNKTS